MMTDTTGGEPAGRRTDSTAAGNPLINRNFALLWSGQAISILGDFVFTTTLVLWVAVIIGRGYAWAPLAVSGVLVASALPQLVLGPLAGVLVDRWDTRRTMIAADAARAALILLLLAVTWGLSGGRGARGWLLGAVYAVVFLVNACDQFFRPAMFTLIGDVVDEPCQARAIGLGEVSVGLGTIVGPPLAAPVLLAFGVRWALLANALSFVISCATVLVIQAPARVSRPASARRTVRDEFLDGLRLVRRTPLLVTLVVASVVAMLGAGALNALAVFFVTRNLHAPAALYGILGAAQGVGAVVGAILAGVYAERLGLARVFATALVLLGALILVYARMTAVVPAALVLFAMGAPLAALSVASGPLILRVTPREFVGRVTSLLTPLMVLASLLSAAVAGYLDGVVLRGFHATIAGVAIGPIDTIFTVAGLLVVAAGLYAWIRFS